MKRITHVKVSGVRFKVVGETVSGSRGREFKLEHPRHPDLVYRLCHAPDLWHRNQINSATASGEILIYERNLDGE